MRIQDKIEYIIGFLDGELDQGQPPLKALEKAIASYAFVFLNIGKGAEEVFPGSGEDIWISLGDDAKLIGMAIREIRNERGLTLRDLAKISGVSPSSISRIENGGVFKTQLRAVSAIVRGLGYVLDMKFVPDDDEEE